MIKAPINVGYNTNGRSGGIPRMVGGGRSMSISHTERLQLITSSGTAFNTIEVEMNPAIPTFPWLCPIAGRFEKYKFRKLSFGFTPILPTTSAGTITYAFDFDPNDSAPLDAITACSYHDFASGSIWAPLKLDIDLRMGDKMPEKLTRLGAPASTDYFNYDVGSLFLCIEGISGNVGYLTVDYVIDLFVHQIEGSVGGEIRYNSGILDFTNLLNTNADPTKASTRVALPGYIEGTGSTKKFIFTQPFEGEVMFEATGNVLTTPQLITTATNKGYFQATNTTGLTATANMIVKAIAGQSIYPRFSADFTTCTSVILGFFPQSYSNTF